MANTNSNRCAVVAGATGPDFINKADMNDAHIMDSKFSDPAGWQKGMKR